MNRFEVRYFSSDADLARTAGNAWVQLIVADQQRAHQHTVALSGGRIAGSFFEATVKELKQLGIATTGLHVFWADERCVAPESPDSNFSTAQKALLGPLMIPQANTHRIHGELREGAVALANAEFDRIVSTAATGEKSLDLVILGMGEDGHVASLFPGASDAVLKCRTPFLFIANSPKPPPERISMSYQTIAAAKQVWVLAAGKGKTDALKNSLAEDGTTPLARVIRSREHTKIYTDIVL